MDHPIVQNGQFNTIFEYNEIFQVGLNGSGFAAMYSCCGPVEGAGVIYRYNFIHSSPNVNGIGWDNQLSGQVGYGNVFYYMQNGFGLNHGSYNSMTNNLIVRNSPVSGQTSFQNGAGISIACRGFSDVYNCSIPKWSAWGHLLETVRINDTNSAWGSRFKWYLGDICKEVATTDGKNQRVVGNYMKDNAIIYIDANFSAKGCNDPKTKPPLNNTFGATFTLPRNSSVDPGFSNYSKLNFTLRKDSIIFKSLPSFKPIPFDDIGLFVDTWRRILPTDADTDRLVFSPYKTGYKQLSGN